MPESARGLVIVHGVVAAIATALAIAAAASRAFRPAATIRLAIAAAVGLGLAVVTGLGLDAPYRAHARQRLFVASADLGWLFERKIHFGFEAACFAVVAVGAGFAAARSPSIASDARRAARLAAVVAAVLAVFATAVSLVVAPRVG